jgi:hypothetical protein
MLNRLLVSSLLALSVLAVGCVSRQTFVRSNIECYVYDADTRAPIPGAAVFMLYKGRRGETVERGPFLADGDGLAHVVVDEFELKGPIGSRGIEEYYKRSIESRARGYVTATIREHLMHFDTKNIDSLLGGHSLEEKGPYFWYLQKDVPIQSSDPTPTALTPPTRQ